MGFILSHASFSSCFQTSEKQSRPREAKRLLLFRWMAWPLLRPPEGGLEVVNRGFESRVQSLILQLISSHLWPRQRVSGRPLICSGHSWEVRTNSWRANIHTQTPLTGRHTHTHPHSITHPYTHRSPWHGRRKTTSAPHTATRRLVKTQRV